MRMTPIHLIDMRPIEIEVINAGKMIIRENIVPYYFPIDESKITIVEVPNMEGEGTHTDTIYPESIVDYYTWDERIVYLSCYALLSGSAYLQLNELISKAKGYNLNDSTARYSNSVPNLCKTNITYLDEVESYTPMAVMEITAEVQEAMPELLTGLTLVDSFIPADASTELTAIDLSSVTVDYTLNHIDAMGTTLELIHLEAAPRTAESDLAVEHLVSTGTTIITVE